MRRLLLAGALSLVVAGGASAEVVAPGVHDGMLATSRSGRPVVAYVRGPTLAVATRDGAGRWRTTRVAAVGRGSSLVALEAGAAGTVALVQSAEARRLLLVRQAGPGWAVTELATHLSAGTTLGWPGLALDSKGLPAVAYTRWREDTHKSALVLARVDRSGRVRSQQVTSQGFPKSHVAPPAAPVFKRGALHVVETYGYDGAVGTIEWGPKRRRGWSGQFLDSGIGDFPVGPLLTAVGPAGTVYAAWTEALLGTGEYPVLLAANGRAIESDMVLTRALTTSLAAPASGVVVGANEWVTAAELGLESGGTTWAGTIASRGRKAAELDGWLAGLAFHRGGSRDLLLARPRGLSWFHAPVGADVRVRLSAAGAANGSVQLSGHLRGYAGGRVSIYRERPGAVRSLAGAVTPARDGSFAFVDRRPLRPLLYRAVYAQPKTGVPYAALLRTPLR